MGSAGASLDNCEDQVEFWKVWNEATRDERHKMGVLIGKKTSELMKGEPRAAGDIRTELAKYVKAVILKKPLTQRAKRKQR